MRVTKLEESVEVLITVQERQKVDNYGSEVMSLEVYYVILFILYVFNFLCIKSLK